MTRAQTRYGDWKCTSTAKGRHTMVEKHIGSVVSRQQHTYGKIATQMVPKTKTGGQNNTTRGPDFSYVPGPQRCSSHKIQTGVPSRSETLKRSPGGISMDFPEGDDSIRNIYFEFGDSTSFYDGKLCHSEKEVPSKSPTGSFSGHVCTAALSQRRHLRQRGEHGDDGPQCSELTAIISIVKAAYLNTPV